MRSSRLTKGSKNLPAKKIKKRAKDIDAYIASAPKEAQAKLKELRAAIKKAAPGAEETISYEMPSLKLNGKGLVAFAAWKTHIGMYPTPSGPEDFEKELLPYKGAKYTLRFPLEEPLPLSLIAKIVKFRIKENLEKAAAKAVSKTQIIYHKDGSIWAKGKSVNGVAEGYWEWFRKDGSKMRTGFFKRGKQVGEWTTYDRAEKVFKVTKMKE